MIYLLPAASETLVLVLDHQEVMRRLRRATTDEPLTANRVTDPAVLFTGRVHEADFRISLKITRPNSFLPLVSGTIEPAAKGCILFMKFRLFRMTMAYLSFWLLFILAAGALGAYRYQNPLALLGAVLAAAVVLYVSWANFNLQMKATRQALEKLLNP